MELTNFLSHISECVTGPDSVHFRRRTKFPKWLVVTFCWRRRRGCKITREPHAFPSRHTPFLSSQPWAEDVIDTKRLDPPNSSSSSGSRSSKCTTPTTKKAAAAERRAMSQGVATKQSKKQTGRSKKNGFFTKLKQVFVPSSSSNLLAASRTRSRDDGESLGTVATRTRSRMSMFGYREHRDQLEAERLLEERKSKCLAIKAAKRDPPAVQRLLVDCEFCNPPPKFGRIINIESPGFDSRSTEDSLRKLESLRSSGADLGEEREWNQGLDEWLHMREWWLTPTAEEQPTHFLDDDLTPDKYYTVFDKMIYNTKPLKHPLNLQEIVKILKAGWVGEGSWPEGQDNDVWSTTDDEEAIQFKAAQAAQAERIERAEHLGGGGGVGANGSGANGGAANTAGEITATGHHDQQQKNGHAVPTLNIPATGATSSSYPGGPGAASASNSNVPSAATSELSLAHKPKDGADVPQIHVQFSDIPHPRDGSPGVSARANMPRLERVQSSYGAPLRPLRSSQSSVVSITDSE